MKTRLATLSVLAAALLLVGCGSLQRAGKDIAVIGPSPITLPLSATYDSLDWGEDSDSATAMMLFPFNFVGHTVKHVAYTSLHVLDLAVAPIYLLASIDPNNDLEPIGLYYLDGYPWGTYPIPYMESAN